MEEGLDSPVQEGCGIKDRGWRRTGLGLALGNGAHALGYFFFLLRSSGLGLLCDDHGTMRWAHGNTHCILAGAETTYIERVKSRFVALS